MKDFTTIQSRLRKIEFWVATAVLAIALMGFMAEAMIDPAVSGPFPGVIGRFFATYLEIVAHVLAVYFSFLLLNFYVVPRLFRWRSLIVNVVLVIVVVAVLTFVFRFLERALVLLLFFGLYSLAKYCAIYLWINSGRISSKLWFVAPGGLVAFVLWMISMFLFLIGEADGAAIAGWAILIPLAIFFYSYSFYSLIPKALRKKRPFLSYLSYMVIGVFISFFPASLLGMMIMLDGEAAMTISMLNVMFQILFTAPFSWLYFKRYMRGKEELQTLQKELGQSTASFDFLRSQINPHFLFNALNTLYGTALQESAERTGEGIQKLGDMMRFMLQENMQEKISLAREIEYLNNYISLQKLRTDVISGVTIQTEIEQQPYLAQIAPMLLIPFVENAFKHGISFREPSYIKVTLTVEENTLHFDVSNSNHVRPENDPEKNKGGIGLINVKQRLALLYAGKHELIIRETAKEFFSHLTIQLS